MILVALFACQIAYIICCPVSCISQIHNWKVSSSFILSRASRSARDQRYCNEPNPETHYFLLIVSLYREDLSWCWIVVYGGKNRVMKPIDANILWYFNAGNCHGHLESSRPDSNEADH